MRVQKFGGRSCRVRMLAQTPVVCLTVSDDYNAVAIRLGWMNQGGPHAVKLGERNISPQKPMHSCSNPVADARRETTRALARREGSRIRG